MPHIDLDQNATTPLDPSVLDAMRPHWLRGGNAESRHALGREQRRGLDRACETVAGILNAHTDEVVFTSGGTESNNLAVLGLAGELSPTNLGRSIVTSPIEHPAVVEPLALLEQRGFKVKHAGVSSEGLVEADAMAEHVNELTSFCTLILANNETGAIQPVARLAELAHRHGVRVHTDAVQAVGRVQVDFRRLGVASLAASAHKFHGPAGVGLLLVARGIQIPPLFHGGGQQRGLRPGTVPVALAVGLAVALDRWDKNQADRQARWQTLRDRIETELAATLGAARVVRNGPTDPSLRLPQTLNISFQGINGDALMLLLDMNGVAVSRGSACASGASKPSPTLLAMGLPDDRIGSSIRISLGAFTTKKEVDRALSSIIQAVRGLETSKENDIVG